MQKVKTNSGQILVETIIGIGVIAFVLAAIIPLFIVGLKGGSEAWKIDSARMLAREEMAAAKALGKDNWNNLYRPLGTNNKGVGNPYHAAISGGAWVLSSGQETVTLNNLEFTRQLIVDNVSRTGTNGAGELEANYNASRDDPSTQKVTVKVTWTGSPSGIELVDYLGRFQNSLWQQTDWSGGPGAAAWQDPPANRYFSRTTAYVASGDIDSSSAAGTLRLAKMPNPGNTKYGNQYVATSTTSIYALNASNRRASMRFTAQTGGNVNQLRIYIDSQRNGNNVSYTYGLQADNAGNPSGSFISSANANFGATGWQTVNLGSPATVVAGNVYHLVVQWSGQGQTPANNRNINLRSGLPNNLLVPLSGRPDAAANTLQYNGTNWLALSQQPIYILGYQDGTFEGNPYDSRASRNIYGVNFEGETFTLAAQKQVSGAGLYVASSNNNLPIDKLYVTLLDLTANTTLVNNETFIDPANTTLTTSFGWLEYNFSSSVTLPANHQFRLYFSSPGSGAARSYLISNQSGPNIVDYIGVNWDGAAALTTRSTNSGGVFTDYSYIDLSYYLLVSAADVYVPTGELISSTFDTVNAGGAGLNRLSWALVGALPANTTVRMQLAANNDNATWNWSGPSGLGSWYTVSTGENVWTDLYSASAAQAARYIRYKIRLDTNDNTVTPVVDWARLNWSL